MSAESKVEPSGKFGAYGSFLFPEIDAAGMWRLQSDFEPLLKVMKKRGLDKKSPWDTTGWGTSFIFRREFAGSFEARRSIERIFKSFGIGNISFQELENGYFELMGGEIWGSKKRPENNPLRRENPLKTPPYTGKNRERGPAFADLENRNTELIREFDISKATNKQKMDLHCLLCCAGDKEEVKNCGCLECTLWKYRTSKTKLHRAMLGSLKSNETLSEKEREKVCDLKVAVRNAEERVLAMVANYCKRKASCFRKAYTGKSRVSAIKAVSLYLANYDTQELVPFDEWLEDEIRIWMGNFNKEGKVS